MKKFIIIGILLIFGHTGFSQKPTIMYLNKVTGPATEEVDIVGSGFSSTSSLLRVYFGAARAEIVSSSESMIKVKVPNGATYDNIKVLNMNSRLWGASNSQFMFSFGGEEFLTSRLTYNEFYTGASPSATGALQDFCICDLDGDGKNDFIAGHEQTAMQTGVYVVRNTSTPSTISSTFSLINLPSITSYVTCADLNNDGKPDIIAVRGGTVNDRIYILINNSSGPGNISFLAPITLEVLSARSLSKVKIVDLDNDGLPDIIVTDNTNITGSNDAVHIFKNKSTNGVAAFETTPITIKIVDDPGIVGDESLSQGVFALDVKDMNNDGYPEIIVAPLAKPNVCVIRNTSSPGNISFGAKTFITVSEAIYDIKVGEINGDGKLDIIVAKVDVPRKFTVLLNETPENGAIKFGTAQHIDLSRRSSSLDVGDINGDGKLDIVFSSIEGPSSSLCILINNSTTNTLSFTEHVVPIRTRQTAVKIADIDNDGRPDLISSLTDNRLAVYFNKNCIVAKTNPSTNVEICTGNTVDISTVRGINLNYTWKINDVDVPNSNTPALYSVGAGKYQVTINSDNGACTSVSSPVNVTLNLGTVPTKPTISANTPACMGENLQFNAQDNGGAAQFKWEGPEGWTSTQQNPLITNVRPQHAGYYMLTAIGSTGCISKKDTLLVSIISLPAIEIFGPDAICSGTAAELSVVNFADHQYQWKHNGNVMVGKTSPTISIDQIGNYTTIITKGSCSYESPIFKVEQIALPTASFTVKNEACVTEPVSFTNTSTIPLQREVVYQWTFGDGNGSTQQNPVHKYTSTGNYNINLKVAYKNTTCVSETQKQINIKHAEAVTIAATSDIFCIGDSLKLEIQGTYPTYEWSNGKKTKSIYVKNAGTFSATITDQTGCIASAEITVDQYPESEFNITTSTGNNTIEIGKSIQLFVNDEYTGYKWTPVSGLSDAEIHNPIAGPRQTTTYTVTAIDDYGCKLTDDITLLIDGSAIKLKAAKIFSPNGDAQNEYWEIVDVQNYEDNEVLIFDGQGKKVFEASPYSNNWDATLNGMPLPKGIYYFIIKLRDSNSVQTGTIMVVR